METRIEIVRYAEGSVAGRHAADAPGQAEADGLRVVVRREGERIDVRASSTTGVEDVGFDLVLRLPEWRRGYVLVPGAVYDGNRARLHAAPYPPMYPAEDPDDAPVVADVPRLPAFHLLAGDAAYPAIGLFDPEGKRAHAIRFPERTELGPTGLRVEEAADGLTIRLQFPGVRTDGRYAMLDTHAPCDDRGAVVEAGGTIAASVDVAERDAEGVEDLFDLLDGRRRLGAPERRRRDLRPFSSAARLVRDVTMRRRWLESPGFFETADSDHGIPFQVGWVGGGITSFALLESDDPLARLRARRNVDFVCERLLAPSGFFYGGYRDGPYNDGFDHPHADRWTMVRKNGDMLLFLLRHILALEASGERVPEGWTRAARACAEAFVRTGRAEGQWGQFVDVDDGRVVVRGSAAGGTAIAGLALAARRFDEPRYRRAAESAGERYAREAVARGRLNGGPGEILKAPDSESAFGLLEGYVVLWETTGDARWLDLAARTARQAASWVVPYDFAFPSESTFGRLDMRTTGTVIANVQNKHSAPGICTLSALSLLKLYRATGERRWLDLATEISHAIPQYVSSATRPIRASNGRTMPPGWINERVNMSDWEAPERGVGEIVDGPCWSMASMLLTELEMPGVYVDPRRGVVACADHVAAEFADGRLALTNPTDDDARVKLLIDRDRDRPLGELWWRGAALVAVPARTSVEISLGDPAAV